ncbi:neuraminidase-like domain-containing protein [Pseudomonas citrulli]|uniref:Neuraminidase-like domain-containing protein n=1 Tax=Pseudomonas citrulli TaxID=3064347 RepID=A0ABT9C6E5_9PSED|nr:neuraminidase-like domain-containing protein [Pseudomonas sp. K18]MDO7899739.1 neuraminidase-like domain-containing protein [Pseudomonas sp. K18]
MTDLTSKLEALSKQRQEALLECYLDAVAARDGDTNVLAAARDLDAYHLFDHHVDTAPKTSAVGEMIASLQRYIHGIYSGDEPGFGQHFDEREVETWRQWESRYAIWAGAEKLQSYPENYIDPQLRIVKTQCYEQLEGDLAQGRLNTERAQSSVLTYLEKFEDVADIEVLNGYIDGPFVLSDSTVYRADYYLLGRKRADDKYYWRKATIALGEGQTRVPPSAWSEWEPIEAGIGDATSVRLTFFGSRLYVFWVSRSSLNEIGGAEGPNWDRFDIRFSYRSLSGTWTPPFAVDTVMLERSDEVRKSHRRVRPNTGHNRLLAVTSDSRRAKGGNVMVLGVVLSTVDERRAEFAYAWDELLNRIDLDDQERQHISDLFALYENQSHLQRRIPLLGEKTDYNGWAVGSIRAKDSADEPEFTRYLDLEARNNAGQSLLVIVKSTLAIHERWIGNSSVRVHPVRPGLSTFFDIEFAVPAAPYIELGMIGYTVVLNFTGGNYKPASCRIEFLKEGGESGEAFEFSLDDSAIFRKYFPALNVGEHHGDAFKYMAWLPERDWRTYGTWLRVTVNGGAAFVINNQFTLRSVVPAPFVLPIWLGTGKVSTGYLPLFRFNGGAGLVKPVPLTANPQIVAVGLGEYSGDTWSRGYQEFEVWLKAPPINGPSIVLGPENAQGQAGQFLDFGDEFEAARAVEAIRLNTTFGRELVERAALSIDNLLSWDSQHTEEPPRPGSDKPEFLDFQGANGRYFWEIFFHLPHLIAVRLRREMSYEDALGWLHYLFDPSARINPGRTETTAYWRSRPLLMEGDPSFEVASPADPDAIAYSNPIHYRKRIFRDYVETLIEWGDWLYRQLTRDSLTEAKMIYLRAERMMGPAPDVRGASNWTPKTLSELEGARNLACFDRLAPWLSADTLVNLPLTSGHTLLAPLLDHPDFRPEINRDLLDVWDVLQARLHNLRHYLTLDGKPIDLPLYDTPINPKDLMRAQAGGGGFNLRDILTPPIVPPYRFMAILPRAQQAVQTLCRFGDQVRQYMEQADRCEQETLQQEHLIEMTGFTHDLQTELLSHAQVTLEALWASQSMVGQRKTYFEGLVEKDLNKDEIEAAKNLVHAKKSAIAAGAASTAGHIGDTLPNIGGLSWGGMKLGGPSHAIAAATSAYSQSELNGANLHDRYGSQQRLRQEWGFQLKVATAELEVLEKQGQAQQVQIQAAMVSLNQQSRATEQAKEMYTFLTQTRTSRTSLYRWMQSKMATLYFQTYDAVTALCLSVQACWQYEIGDYESHFILPGAWVDSHHGFTAGETLTLGLLRMESAYVHRYERRLTIRKMVSLRDYFAPEAWSEKLQMLGSTGKLDFNLDSRFYDGDYPGHYLRQIRRVSVTLPAVLGPYEMACMTLTQISSKLLIKPSLGGARHLYDPQHPDADTTYVRYNLRAQPQIAVSDGLDDDGIGSHYSFEDDRYASFERTGAISSWQLAFPRFQESDKQKRLIESLTDIIVHVEYTALDGGNGFAEKIEELLNETAFRR